MRRFHSGRRLGGKPSNGEPVRSGHWRHCLPGLRSPGLAVVCPLTSKVKPYPFSLPIKVGSVEGAVLVDQLTSMDWEGRGAEFHSKAPANMIAKVRQYIAVLLQIPVK